MDVRIGIRELYETVDCSLGSLQPLEIYVPIDDHRGMHLYLGPTPHLGYSVIVDMPEFLSSTTEFKLSYSRAITPADEGWRDGLYLEAVAWVVVPVADSLAIGFEAGEQSAVNQVLKLVDVHEKQIEPHNALSLGVVNLYLNDQFVFKKLVSERVAFKASGEHVAGVTSSAMRILKQCELREKGRVCLRVQLLGLHASLLRVERF